MNISLSRVEAVDTDTESERVLRLKERPIYLPVMSSRGSLR